MLDDSTKSERIRFLGLAFAIEGGLLVAALVAAWLLGRAPWTKLRLSLESVALGILATIPLLIFLAFTYYTRIPRLVQFRELTRELLERPLAACGWFDLCAISLAAGVSEEFLFRGVLEPWLNPCGPILAVIVCNLVFGLCHALTPTYFVFATLVGLYLSLTLRWGSEPNLVVPICCHALYDLAAFAVIRSIPGASSKQGAPLPHTDNDLQDPPNDDGQVDSSVSR